MIAIFVNVDGLEYELMLVVVNVMLFFLLVTVMFEHSAPVDRSLLLINDVVFQICKIF